MPCEAAFIEQTISCGPSSRWKASTASWRRAAGVGAEDVRGVGEALEHRVLGGDVLGEHHQRLARGQEVGDPGAARWAACRAPASWRRLFSRTSCSARSAAATLASSVRRSSGRRLQPGDHVLLGQPVLLLVGEQHRHGVVALGRQLGQHLLLGAAHVAVGAQVPVQAVVAAGVAEAPRQAGAAAELAAAGRARAAATTSSSGRLRIGVPVRARRSAPSGSARGQLERGLGPLGAAGSSRSATRRARARAARARPGARHGRRGCRS